MKTLIMCKTANTMEFLQTLSIVMNAEKPIFFMKINAIQKSISVKDKCKILVKNAKSYTIWRTMNVSLVK